MPRVIPDQIAFAADNLGRSFFNLYELLDAAGKGTGIQVEVHDENHAEQIARRVAAAWNACAGVDLADLEAGRITVLKSEPSHADNEAEVLSFLREQGFVSADKFLQKAEAEGQGGIELMINPKFGKKKDEVIH